MIIWDNDRAEREEMRFLEKRYFCVEWSTYQRTTLGHLSKAKRVRIFLYKKNDINAICVIKNKSQQNTSSGMNSSYILKINADHLKKKRGRGPLK